MRASHLRRLGLPALAALALLAACVRLVEPYDPVLDQGLTTYYQEMDAFLTRTAAATAAGQESARYEANRDTYLATGARLNMLLVRARAFDETGVCAGGSLAAAIAGQLARLGGLGGDLADAEEALEQLRAAEEERPGNCTVQGLRTIRANHEILEAIHAHNDGLDPIVVEIALPTIAQGVEIALRAERAKRRGEE